MNRFMSNQFDENSFHTIGVEFLNKDTEIDGEKYTLQWVIMKAPIERIFLELLAVLLLFGYQCNYKYFWTTFPRRLLSWHFNVVIIKKKFKPKQIL